MKKQARAQPTIDRVLQAALASFVGQGLFQATIHDISEKSGVSVGSIYHHFGSREGVFLALYQHCLEEMLASIASRVLPHSCVKQGIFALVHGYLDYVEQNQSSARFIYAAAHTAMIETQGQQLSEHAQRIVTPLALWLQPFVESGQVLQLPPALFEVVLIGPPAEACRRILTGHAGFDFKQAHQFLPDRVWTSLAGNAGI
jgi:AcrR family transcriptional regulator